MALPLLSVRFHCSFSAFFVGSPSSASSRRRYEPVQNSHRGVVSHGPLIALPLPSHDDLGQSPELRPMSGRRQRALWHLGFCNWNYTPTYRGFDSFYGFYNGQDDYYKHTVRKCHFDLENMLFFRFSRPILTKTAPTRDVFIDCWLRYKIFDLICEF
ncbi:hypothetical protein Bbelb_028010 [Branchiostoma belcheri]|nr:hypothetical protein Bbelb_028010 [Branchiostoma belcheri]